jgi:hypothetical protein
LDSKSAGMLSQKMALHKLYRNFHSGSKKNEAIQIGQAAALAKTFKNLGQWAWCTVFWTMNCH